jgi:cobalt/nickel transport system permease protein
MKIDTIAYTNRLRYLPPSHKLSFALLLLGLAYAAPVVVQLLIALWITVWIIIYAGVPWGTYGHLLAAPAGFWLTSLPALVLGLVRRDPGPDILADIWGFVNLGDYMIYVSRQGLQQAVTLLARGISVSSCLYFVILTIPFVDLLDILRRCKCPALLIDLLMLMYRFIFTLLRTSNELWIAQYSRNGYRTWQLSMKSLGILVAQLLQRTLINYRQVSLSLDSRGFNGEFRVVHSRKYRFSWRYSLEAIAGSLALAVLIGQYYAGI